MKKAYVAFHEKESGNFVAAFPLGGHIDVTNNLYGLLYDPYEPDFVRAEKRFTISLQYRDIDD